MATIQLYVCFTGQNELEQPQQANVVDVARFKQASQSSSYGTSNPPSAAVDDSPETCSRTGEEKGASWILDLGETHVISQMQINTG